MAPNANEVPLVASVARVLNEVLKDGSIIIDGEIPDAKLRKPRQGSPRSKHTFPVFTFNIFQDESPSCYRSSSGTRCSRNGRPNDTIDEGRSRPLCCRHCCGLFEPM